MVFNLCYVLGLFERRRGKLFFRLFISLEPDADAQNIRQRNNEKMPMGFGQRVTSTYSKQHGICFQGKETRMGNER